MPKNLQVELLDGVDPGRGRGGARDGAALRARGRAAGRHLVGRDAGGDRPEAARACADGATVLGFNYDTGERYLSIDGFLPVANEAADSHRRGRARHRRHAAVRAAHRRLRAGVVRDRRGGAARIARRRRRWSILDVGLPDASGFEIFKRVRETSDVPVVFLTARSDEIDRVVGLELGADDYIAKPFSPRELVARVRSVLRRTAKAAQPRAPPAARPAAASGPIAVDEGRMQVRYYGRAARALALRVRPAEDARLAAGPRLHARGAARPRLGRRQRQHGPHRRRARQDAARQDEGDRPAARPDPHLARQRLRARRGPAGDTVVNQGVPR